MVVYVPWHGMHSSQHTKSGRKLWRISALVIANPAVLCFLLNLLLYATIFAGSISRFCCRRLALDPKPKSMKKSQQKPVAVKGLSSLQRSARFGKIIMSILRGLGGLVRSLTVGAFIFLYILARGYFVYESFRTVFFLPPEAYRMTRWTQYLPHIT